MLSLLLKISKGTDEQYIGICRHTRKEVHIELVENIEGDQKKLIERYDRRIDTIRKKFNKSLSKKQRILITKSKRKRSKKND